MRKRKRSDRERDDFLDRQLRQEAHELAKKQCEEKGHKRNPYNDPYDPYWSYLTTYEVTIYNELRIKHGLAKPHKKPGLIERIFKPARPTFKEEWQNKIYG